MTNTEMLKKAIADSGLKIGFLAKSCGMSRSSLYNKMSGSVDFSATEIVKLSSTLGLSRKQRDDIFFNVG